MATQTVNWTQVSTNVEVQVEEFFVVKRDGKTTNQIIFEIAETEPSDEEYANKVFSDLDKYSAYPIELRTHWEVINRNPYPDSGEQTGYSSQLNQFNPSNESILIPLHIPIEQLPESYTDKDIIDWGRNNGILRLESSVY